MVWVFCKNTCKRSMMQSYIVHVLLGFCSMDFFTSTFGGSVLLVLLSLFPFAKVV